ncbi:MAG: DnaB-like helicase C-terminal domain-containing protein [Lachnospiraceae bacterium]|nr:DnaB-like helicase C-terminal domain-containing protein [Lachnospiraceae bacterium]
MKGIPTGFYDLDYMTQGLQKGNLILLAGRFFIGKAALALSISRYVVLKENRAVAYFSSRCSGKQVITRLLSMDSEVNILDIAYGKIDKDDRSKLKESAKRIANAPLYIDDSPCITVSKIRNKCWKLKKSDDLGLIVIDGLQFIVPDTRWRHCSVDKRKRSIMIGLKKLANEMDCPVIVISKLPELVDLYGNRRPEITDLDSTDYSAQYSDVIIFMYQDRSLQGKIPDKDILTDLIIAKNRSGKDGVVKLRPQFEYSRFVNVI